MSAGRLGPSPTAWRAPAGALLPADGLTLGIYLAAFTVPGIGSTVVWLAARSGAERAALTAHYRRALRIQLACLLGMVAIQAVVTAALWLGFPGEGPAALHGALVLVGLHLTVGLYLLMGLLGPVLVVAERPRPAVPVSAAEVPTAPPRRTPPTPPSIRAVPG